MTDLIQSLILLIVAMTCIINVLSIRANTKAIETHTEWLSRLNKASSK